MEAFASRDFRRYQLARVAGILGASLAPYIATWLAKNLGLQYVGYYLSAAALLTLVGLLMIRESKDDDL